MLARDLDKTHIGADVTITVSGLPTGGVLTGVSAFMGMVSLDFDETNFTVDGGSPVLVAAADPRTAILSESDTDKRHELIDAAYGRRQLSYR
ncbi:hypothetical protein [Frigoribacterium sp. SL97]|uniref:hypothetical protein n=1 Tax=Frigoribacterium sp. SL97 TaxID=2994664 RepID=UPI0022717D7E|nr:hypothetical protein [Frigoribacterium sp. SL97]WAC50454.1 hypothetical protein OVA02_11290 [Frigoribacterium sp. SL97]